VIVVDAGGLMRSGIANDRATPTSAGGSEGYGLGRRWRRGDGVCDVSYVGDETNGVGLE
jgi:hypothetical protein